MSETAIGIVTFGNHEFTRLGLKELSQTVHTNGVKTCVVVGKPNDRETLALLDKKIPLGLEIEQILHEENKGFPASLNDLYDWAWPQSTSHAAGAAHAPFESEHGREFDNLIIMGNDVVPYPGAIDALIKQADESDYDVICSCMIDVRALCSRYPEAGKYFGPINYEFTDFSARPWDLHGPENILPHEVVEGSRGGLHDLTLFKRSVFDKIGYIDAGFFPAYFSDNDYWQRMMMEGVKCCSVTDANYFHFWSRTIHQGGKTDHTGGDHFRLNEEFYAAKWGGMVGEEKWRTAFNGKPYPLGLHGGIVTLPGTNKITSRADEPRVIEYWKNRAGKPS